MIRLVRSSEGEKILSNLARIDRGRLMVEGDKQIHTLVNFEMTVEVTDRPIMCKHDWWCGDSGSQFF